MALMAFFDHVRRVALAERRSAREMAAIMKNAPIGIVFTRDRRLVRYNAKVAEIMGLRGDEGLGRPTRDFFRSDEEFEALGRLAAPLLSQGRAFQRELFMRRQDDGREVWVNLVGYVQNLADTREGTIWLLEDRSEIRRAREALERSRDELEARVRERTAELEEEVVQRRRAEERLKYLALYDGLTGLANRNLLRSHLGRALGEAQVAGAGAVLFVDIDRFKSVNDNLGHPVGDGVLREVAQRIACAVRATDFVARFGGDEFVVVAGGVGGAEGALRLAQNIQAGLQRPIRLGSQELFATPSIGIALFPGEDATADTLLRQADAAMYQAKAAGRNTVRLFDARTSAATQHYFRTESSLRRAIERGEFEPHYQPIVDLQSGSCVGLELLLRWRRGESGLALPAEFIPVAEDCGLVTAIGAQVLESACRQMRLWREEGIDPPRLAINLSALQFRDPRCVEAIGRTLERNSVSPASIELEITETVLMQNGDHTLATLEALARAGFTLSIDDFGTGYSSLAYLKRFPVSKLKIDRSFIEDMTQDPDDEAIVRMIIALARSLRIATVAEGVETAAQRESLRRLGCDLAQGYLFGHPMEAAQARSYLMRDPAVATA